jgi:hypothetical protein
MLRQTSVFASGGICGSRSALLCVRGAKRRRTIFLARVGPVLIPQKTHQKTLCQTCVFAFGGICRSRNAFCASGAQNVDALFFMLRWDWCNFHKKHIGTSYVELVLLHLV